MKQKIKLVLCLVFGISFAILQTSCSRDYQVRAKWIFINETEYRITYLPDVEFYKQFELKPYDTVVYSEDYEGPKEISPEDYSIPLDAYIMVFDSNRCDTLFGGSDLNNGHGPRGIQNYESKKLGDRYYEFTYRITQAAYDSAQFCDEDVQF